MRKPARRRAVASPNLAPEAVTSPRASAKAMTFALRYTAIRVRDLDRSLAFYTQVLGLTLRHRISAPETKGEFAI